MTEEIIIDCAFYKDGVCASPIYKTCEYCKNIDVSKCYHKQLKRLEQENKELVEDNLNIYKENRELKIYIESNKQQVEDVETLVMDNDRLQQEVENLKDTIYYDVEKYRSALEEIREYCSRIERGEVIGTQDCLINSIKNIVNYTINEVLK